MSFLKKSAKQALYYSGYYSIRSFLRRPSHHRLLIVMYHNLFEDDAAEEGWSRESSPTRSQFASHVAALSRRFRVCSLEEAVEEIRHSGKLTAPTACITFDDGYESNYHIAFPILKKHHLPATVFLPTDWINGKDRLWWLQLTELLSAIPIEPRTLPEIEEATGLTLNSKLAEQGEKRARSSVLQQVEKHLSGLSRDRITDVLERLRELLPQGEELSPVGIKPLTWEQIREMAGYGIRFGAHTMSHYNLLTVAPETAEKEIAGSKQVIEDALGTRITGLAYTFGKDPSSYARFHTFLEKHGFQYAVTADHGVNEPTANLLELRRISLPLTTSPALLGRLLLIDYDGASPEGSSSS